MPDDIRITVDQLRARMEAGEDFTIIDTRNPQAWAASDQELPEDKPIVTYCT
jgi:rhodanese-related sulfurtransferase